MADNTGKPNPNLDDIPPAPTNVFNPVGGLVVEVYNNNLEAKLTAKFSFLKNGVLSMQNIQEALDRYRINSERVDLKAIAEALFDIQSTIDRSGNNPPETKSYVIAKGYPVKQGRDGILNFYFARAQRVVIKEDGSADFRNTDRYVHVSEGDKLATLFECRLGVQGVDVFGTILHPTSIIKQMLVVGTNIRIEERKDEESPEDTFKDYFATCSGVIFQTDNSITVSPELIIESNVGLGSGNVNYDGSVNINGTIEEGASVKCSGTLTVTGNAESLDITVKQNLELKGGIKGKGKGTVRVKGDLRAKFIENANLEVEGDIFIETNILNSKVYCLGNVFLTGDTGSIIGTELWAFNGLSVPSLGSQAELDTVIEVGYHYKNDLLFTEGTTKLKQMEQELEALIPELQKMKLIIARQKDKIEEDKKVKIKQMLEDYQNKTKLVGVFRNKIENLKVSRYNPESIKVVIKKGAFPNVVIKYRKQIEKFTKFTSSFMLNFFPAQEKAVIQAWTQPSEKPAVKKA